MRHFVHRQHIPSLDRIVWSGKTIRVMCSHKRSKTMFAVMLLILLSGFEKPRNIVGFEKHTANRVCWNTAGTNRSTAC